MHRVGTGKNYGTGNNPIIIYNYYDFIFSFASHYFGRRFLTCSLAGGKGLSLKTVAVFTGAVGHQRWIEVPALSSAEGPTTGCARGGNGAFNLGLVRINAVENTIFIAE